MFTHSRNPACPFLVPPAGLKGFSGSPYST